jgi:hypothetical protein
MPTPDYSAWPGPSPISFVPICATKEIVRRDHRASWLAKHRLNSNAVSPFIRFQWNWRSPGSQYASKGPRHLSGPNSHRSSASPGGGPTWGSTSSTLRGPAAFIGDGRRKLEFVTMVVGGSIGCRSGRPSTCGVHGIAVGAASGADGATSSWPNDGSGMAGQRAPRDGS